MEIAPVTLDTGPRLRSTVERFRDALLQDDSDNETSLSAIDRFVSSDTGRLQFWGMPGCCIQPVFAYAGASPVSSGVPGDYLERLIRLLAIGAEHARLNETSEANHGNFEVSASFSDANHLPRRSMALYAMNEPETAADFIRVTHSLSVTGGSDYLYVFFIVDATSVHISHIIMGETME